MNYGRTLLVVCCGLVLGQVPAARGQGLLDRLEGRLNNLLAPPAAPTTPAPPLPGDTGYLGLVVDDDTESGGIRVLAVRPRSPAETAGLKVDDVVNQINGQAMENVEDMAQLLEKLPAGSKVQFDIRRGGRASRLTATLSQRPMAEPLVAGRPPGVAAQERPALGLTVAPVTDEARVRYNLTVRRGALITAVAPGGPAHRAGLPIGGVIVAYDGQAIHTAEEMIGMVRSAQIGDEVELSYYEEDQLYRKKLRVAPGEVADLEFRRRPPTEPPLVVRPGDDRGAPALGRLERLIEGVVRPPGSDSSLNATSNEVVILRRQVETLQTQVDELQKRLRDLEERLPRAPEKKD